MRILKLLAKGLVGLIAVALVVLVVGFAVLWVRSPGTPQPVYDQDGAVVTNAISAIETVTLGGVDQTIIVRGARPDARVMLFLHGGPGSPEYAFLRRYNTGLEADFIMVYWEQRGAGMSYDSTAPLAELTVDQLVSDTAELAGHLRKVYGQEKVYLMGHSFGSLLGLLTVARHPEHFAHYFGVGQIAHQHRGEQVGLDWALAQAQSAGHAKAEAELAGLNVPDVGADFLTWSRFIGPQRRWLDHFGGGTTHEPTGFIQLVGMVLATPEYTLSDKGNFMRGSRASLEAMWNDIVAIDLRSQLGPIAVPVTILHGAFDYVTPRPLAEELFETLETTDKELVIFETSAHSPLIEEADRFNAIVRDRAFGSQP